MVDPNSERLVMGLNPSRILFATLTSALKIEFLRLPLVIGPVARSRGTKIVAHYKFLSVFLF